MELLPRTIGTRPRLACEVSAEGVVAARAEDALAVLSAVSRVTLAQETVVPRLHAVEADDSAANYTSSGVGGNAAGRAAIVAAVRKALDDVCVRSREVTLIVPDASLRVLLLDFDELPSKPVEVLPVVRFRLKKLLPFDADDAAVSYQVMSTTKSSVQVLAVAIPRDLLADYESVVREAGYEPGAVLPSTLAALAGVDEREAPVLVVNAGHEGITTAIVKAGVLLLHRTVDLGADRKADRRSEAAAARSASNAFPAPLLDRERSSEEWERQKPDSFGDANDGQNGGQDGDRNYAASATGASHLAWEIEEEIAAEAGLSETASGLAETANEVVQAVSVAAAYFEDTLEVPPPVLHAAGTLGAQALAALLEAADVGPLPVQEIVQAQMLSAAASAASRTGKIPFGWLAGVRGALAN